MIQSLFHYYLYFCSCCLLAALLPRWCSAEAAVDPSGYVAYCPCMGRFGNQADHFLGAMGFARALNRTLLLPHWIEYRAGQAKSVQVPFDAYFSVDALAAYHRVQLMADFMDGPAARLWPPDERASFCYARRGESDGCNAKSGNPFQSFWDTYGVDFTRSVFYAPLNHDVYHHDMAAKWRDRYPPSEWPVLAFVGAPASFPVQRENVAVHRHLNWNDAVDGLAASFLRDRVRPGKIVGLHLRNGVDWSRACDHVTKNSLLFSAPQCLGYRNEYGKATPELCSPSFETIVKQLKRLIRRDDRDIAAVFVASDNNHLIPELAQALASFDLKIVKYDRDSPHVDLAILGKTEYFIGNCISSFSAFVKRERDSNGLPSEFWAFPIHQKTNQSTKDEL